MPLSSLVSDASTWMQQAPDSLWQRADSVAYDSVWSASEPVPQGLERIMVVDGKIYVVVAVLLLIWFGLLAYIYRTDQKLDRLERHVAEEGTDYDDTPA